MLRSGFVKYEDLQQAETPAEKSKSIKNPKPEVIALEKKQQTTFSKKVQGVKKNIQSGNIQIDESVHKKSTKSSRGVVYLSHIPHGFYEKEILEYFKQFGKVTDVIICRSKNTGRSKGFGYVQFENVEVARIAAETMNNYLMFKRRLVAQFIPPEKCKRGLFKMKVSAKNPPKKRNRKEANKLRNSEISNKKHIAKSKKKLKRVQKKLENLKKLGVDYNLHAVDVPEVINKTLGHDEQIPKNKKKKKVNKNKNVSFVVKNENPNKVNKKSSGVNKINKKVISMKKSNAKNDLIKLASKELLKNSDHIIVTRSAMMAKLNKKTKK